MKPNWEDAPKYANFLAQDENGSWAWYEMPPIPQYSAGYWANYKGQWETARLKNGAPDWVLTLESRP